MNNDLELMDLINEIDSDDDTILTTSYYSSDSDYTIEEDYEERENHIKYLDENDFSILQPKTILTKLYNYQLRSLYKMIEMENTGYIKNIYYGSEKYHIRCLNNQPVLCDLKTNIGIYSDKQGKILTLISLIKLNEKIPNYPIIQKTGSGLELTKKINDNLVLNQTLLIVEHTDVDRIYNDFNKNCPSLKVLLIATQKHLDNIVIGSWEYDNIWSKEGTKVINKEKLITDEINNYDVILVSHILYIRLYQSTKYYKWNRVIIMNCNNYELPQNLELRFNFLWFSISNYMELYENNCKFINDIFGKEEDDVKAILDYLIVINK
jgi:hypothetical protein